MNIDRNISDTPKVYRIKNVRQGSSGRLLRGLPKDTFEKTKDANMPNNENDNLQFKRIKIEFYPEDVERMKDMDLEERIRYKQQLKAQNRYIKLDDENTAE